MPPVAAMRRRLGVPAWSCRSVRRPSGRAAQHEPALDPPRSGSGRPSQPASTAAAVVPCTWSAMPSRSTAPPGVTLAIWPVACSVWGGTCPVGQADAQTRHLQRREIAAERCRAASRPRSAASIRAFAAGSDSSAWPTTCTSRPCPLIRSATLPRAVSSRPASAADSSPARRGGVPVIEPAKFWVIAVSPAAPRPREPTGQRRRTAGRCTRGGVAARHLEHRPQCRQIGRRGRELQVGAAYRKSGSELEVRDVAAHTERRTVRCAGLKLDPGDVQGLVGAAQLQLTRDRAEIGQRPVEPGREARHGGRAREVERDAIERTCRAPTHGPDRALDRDRRGIAHGEPQLRDLHRIEVTAQRRRALGRSGERRLAVEPLQEGANVVGAAGEAQIETAPRGRLGDGAAQVESEPRQETVRSSGNGLVGWSASARVPSVPCAVIAWPSHNPCASSCPPAPVSSRVRCASCTAVSSPLASSR